MLETDKAKAQMLRFFQEYFDYSKAPSVFKDKIKNHIHSPKGLVRDLDTLIKKVNAKLGEDVADYIKPRLHLLKGSA